MMLLIDAGNTRLKWCWFDGEDVPLDYESAEYDDLDAEGASLFKTPGADVERIIICSVAGEDTAGQIQEVFADWKIEPEFLASKPRSGDLTNAYANPGQLGVDRWMAMLGAWEQEKDALCIVDCGTAVTIDVVNDQGSHLGGMIIPGLELMHDALVDGTGQIETGQVETDDQAVSEAGLLARDTGSAVAAGTLYALVALIERVVSDLAQELPVEPVLILTGGDAESVQPLLSYPARYEPMLIFMGMLIAAEENA